MQNVAWTGDGEQVDDFIVGELVYTLNPYFADGTRLRSGPSKEADFSGEAVLNDREVEVVELTKDGFAKIREYDDFGSIVAEGWLRQRNLTHVKRGMGLRGVRDHNAVTPAQPQRAAFAPLNRGTTISDLRPVMHDESSEETSFVDKSKSVNGLFSMKSGGGPAAASQNTDNLLKMQAVVQAHVAQVRAQLRQRKKTTLDPHSAFMQRWDSVTAFALLYTASITPFEVCVLEPTRLDEMLGSPLAWSNRVIDSIFIVDICMQFFLAYQEVPEKGGNWVHNNWQIARRYATSWFALDITTALPVDVVVAAYEASQEAAAAATPGGATVADSDGAGYLRMVRMLRLLKLARILRASRIFRRWQAHFGISFAMLALLKFVVLLLVTSHWLACAWVLLGKAGGEPSPLADEGGFFRQSWMVETNLTDAAPLELYGVAIFMAYSSITSSSSGTVQPVSPFEFYLWTAANVFGSAVWAYIISSACGIIATLNPTALHYRHVMDELNFFARDKKLPRQMTIQLREFVAQTQQFHRQRQYDELLNHFSTQLKARAALHWAKDSLMRVPYFKSGVVEDDFLAGAALALRARVLCRTETISVEELTVIERGIAARSGRIYPKGTCLGVDMILNTVTFRDFNSAVALTFVVQIASLEKKKLEELLMNYPRARREIRAAAFKLAFTRAVILVAKEITNANALGQPTTIDQAFVAIRRAKARTALEYQAGEPTRMLLASSIGGLAERTEALAREGESSREQLSNQMRSLTGQVAALGAKFDSILEELKRRPPPRHRQRGPPNETKDGPPARLRRGQSSSETTNGGATGSAADATKALAVAASEQSLLQA